MSSADIGIRTILFFEASLTAFAIDGGADINDGSPIPLAPNGPSSKGSSTISIFILGISFMPGIT
jgi:hypothetical protein